MRDRATEIALLVVAALAAAIAPPRVATAQVAPTVAGDSRPAASAGTQFAMPGRPFGLGLSPDGRRLLVTGQSRQQSLTLVDVRSGRTLQRLRFRRPRSVAGAAVFTADGAGAYVAGGGSGAVWRYVVHHGRLVERRLEFGVDWTRGGLSDTGPLTVVATILLIAFVLVLINDFVRAEQRKRDDPAPAEDG